MTPVGWEGLGISNATMAAFFLPGAGVNMYLPVYVERVGGVAGSVQCGRACSGEAHRRVVHERMRRERGASDEREGLEVGRVSSELEQPRV